MQLNTRSFLRIVIPFGIVSLLSCTTREPYREYSITHCEKDTAILVDNLQSSMGNCNVSIIVEGSIDSTAAIDFHEYHHENYRKYGGIINFRLAKGVFSKKEKNEMLKIICSIMTIKKQPGILKLSFSYWMRIMFR
jgi:hypothetical protein